MDNLYFQLGLIRIQELNLKESNENICTSGIEVILIKDFIHPSSQLIIRILEQLLRRKPQICTMTPMSATIQHSCREGGLTAALDGCGPWSH